MNRLIPFALAVAILGCANPAVPATTSTNAPARRIYTVGGDVRPPIVVSHAEAVLPKDAKCRGLVLVSTIIDENGAPEEAKDITPNPDAFSRAEAASVLRWRFRPATLHGKPVAVRYTVTMSFRCQ